jgi:hypothetical protein
MLRNYSSSLEHVHCLYWQGAMPSQRCITVQAQLDAEASTRSAPGWLMSEGREAHSPAADHETSWAQVRGRLRHC